MNTTALKSWALAALLPTGISTAFAQDLEPATQVAVVSSYTQNFNSLGSLLPDGWGIWTGSTAGGNGTAYSWSTAQIANNAGFNATSAFRNVPGASQAWATNLSTGTDRALGWRAGDSASRDGSITFTFSSTLGWEFTSLSFDIFTPNNSGTAEATVQLEYQIGTGNAFIAFAGKLYTTGTPLKDAPITLNSAELAVINNQDTQVTLRLNNTATTGTTFHSVAIDNFSYTAIPEPAAAAALAGAAVLSLGLLRRRRRLAP